MSFKQPWVNVAQSKLGLWEYSEGSNPQILSWAKDLGLSKDYNSDSIPWCGLFVAWIMFKSNIKPVSEPLWALSWNKFGTKLSEPAFGCVMVFKRNGGGHVGIYISEDANTYHILGGNQSDQVKITKIAKERCVGYRWPPGQDDLLVKGRIRKEFSGKLSTNEA